MRRAPKLKFRKLPQPADLLSRSRPAVAAVPGSAIRCFPRPGCQSLSLTGYDFISCEGLVNAIAALALSTVQGQVRVMQERLTLHCPGAFRNCYPHADSDALASRVAEERQVSDTAPNVLRPPGGRGQIAAWQDQQKFVATVPAYAVVTSKLRL